MPIKELIFLQMVLRRSMCTVRYLFVVSFAVGQLHTVCHMHAWGSIIVLY